MTKYIAVCHELSPDYDRTAQTIKKPVCLGAHMESPDGLKTYIDLAETYYAKKSWSMTDPLPVAEYNFGLGAQRIEIRPRPIYEDKNGYYTMTPSKQYCDEDETKVINDYIVKYQQYLSDKYPSFVSTPISEL